MSLLDNMPHAATARRRTRAQGELGGSRDTFTDLFADRACWRQAVGDGEVREFDKRGITVTDKVYFTADPEVDERDVLVIGGDTLEVRSRAVPDASVGMGIVWRIMADCSTT